jgi:DNA-binding MarR family transcriptional regulator
MTVAELLGILLITKQSLGRVLKQLIDEGYVEQRKGADRRQRLLFVTAKGEALALKLAVLQTARIGRAFASLDYADLEAARRFLIAMLDPGQRDSVLRLIDGGESRRRRL